MLRYILRFFILFFSAIIFNSCFKSITKRVNFYSNDFNNNDLRGFRIYKNSLLVTNPVLDTFNNSIVFGRFNNTYTEIEVSDIPTHNAIEVSYDLYVHDNWQGDLRSINNVPDLFVMRVNDSINQITTFSNDIRYTQTYPNWYIGAPVSPAKGNSLYSLSGVCGLIDKKDGTTLYRITETFPHLSNKFKVSFSDALQGDKCSKSWSLDNFQLTAILY